MDIGGCNKDCLVIMPAEQISGGYRSGHFRSVYEILIKPSILRAGMTPVSTYDFVRGEKVDYERVINKIMKASVVIFDLSTLDPGVVTALKIRQAFDHMPRILLKDELTPPDNQLIKNSHLIEYSKESIEKQNISITRLTISLSLLKLESQRNPVALLN